MRPAAAAAATQRWTCDVRDVTRREKRRERDDARRTLERFEAAEDLRLLRRQPLGGNALVRFGARVDRGCRRASRRTRRKRDAALRRRS